MPTPRRLRCSARTACDGTTSRRTARGERSSAARDARARRSSRSSARTTLPQNRPAARSHTTPSSDLGRDSAARPVSLRLSLRHAGDATRTVTDGVLVAALACGGAGRAWQQANGTVQLRAPSEAGIEELRFVLALEDDHSEFLKRFARDPLIGEATRRVRGLRPVRTPTVAHALLRAVCGQLIQARRARAIERSVDPGDDSDAGGYAAQRAPGLLRPRPPRSRGAAPLRPRDAPSRDARAALPLGRARAAPGPAQRGGGRPSVARAGARPVVGRRGLPGGPRALRARTRRRPRAREAPLGHARAVGRGWETAELLEPYGEWAGLASVYLLVASGLGLVALPGTAAA